MSGKLHLTKEEQELYDQWSKEDIYAAYLYQYHNCRHKGRELNRLNKIIAGLEFDLKKQKGDNE